MSETAIAPELVPETAQKLAAEAIGTFVLVLFGVGTAVVSDGSYLATGLAFGLAVLVMAYAVGRISGGHFNPAVSLGAAVSGRISWRDAGLYGLVQLAGGIVGGLVLWVLMQGFPGFDSRGNFGQNSYGDAGSGYAWWAAFLIELLMTAIFLGVILAVTDERNEHPALAPLAIGFALVAIHLASMGATGTSVNPARSIGANLFAGSDAVIQLWLFILAPLLGAVLTGSAYPLIFGRGADPVPGSGLRGRPRPVLGVPGYGAPDTYQQQWNQDAPPSPQAAPSPPTAPPVTQQPWIPQGFPPAPTEPYWSQQLPQWETPAEGDDDEDGRTQIRPSDGR